MSDKVKIYIEVDVNDGDMVGIMREVSVDKAQKLSVIMDKVRHKISVGLDWPYHEYSSRSIYEVHPELTHDEIDMICDLCPYGEYGFHTIVSIEIFIGGTTKVI